MDFGFLASKTIGSLVAVHVAVTDLAPLLLGDLASVVSVATANLNRFVVPLNAISAKAEITFLESNSAHAPSRAAVARTTVAGTTMTGTAVAVTRTSPVSESLGGKHECEYGE